MALTEWAAVAKVGELADNDMMMVTVGPEEILLAHVQGSYYAIDNWCTHAGGMLDQGVLHGDSLEVECPLHEGYFHLESGAARLPPAEEDAIAYSVKVEGDQIFIGPKGA
jgi:nitrite reductase/ring-hydroxylating ferredoxin subunit